MLKGKKAMQKPVVFIRSKVITFWLNTQKDFVLEIISLKRIKSIVMITKFQ